MSPGEFESIVGCFSKGMRFHYLIHLSLVHMTVSVLKSLFGVDIETVHAVATEYKSGK